MRRLLALGGGFGFGVLLAVPVFLLVEGVLRLSLFRTERRRPEDTVMVMVAAHELEAGRVIELADLVAIEIPPRFLPAGVYLSPDQVIGWEVTAPILVDESVRAERLGWATGDDPQARWGRALRMRGCVRRCADGSTGPACPTTCSDDYFAALRAAVATDDTRVIPLLREKLGRLSPGGRLAPLGAAFEEHDASMAHPVEVPSDAGEPWRVRDVVSQALGGREKSCERAIEYGAEGLEPAKVSVDELLPLLNTTETVKQTMKADLEPWEAVGDGRYYAVCKGAGLLTPERLEQALSAVENRERL